MNTFTYIKKRFTRRKFSEESFGGRGFTLIEALVAIAILLVGVVEPLSMAARSVFNANVAKDQITAFYLAQEGIEFVRAKRDTNILNGNTGNNWLADLSNCINESASESGGAPVGTDVCTFDVINDPNNAGSFIACTSLNDCDPLREIDNEFDSHPPRYGLDGTSPLTSYERAVTITETVTGREAEILVKVIWKTALLDREFIIRERIFNWSF